MFDAHPPTAASSLMISTRGIADLTGTSVPTVRRMLAAGALPQPRALPGRRVVRWLRADIEAWAKALPAVRSNVAPE